MHPLPSEPPPWEGGGSPGASAPEVGRLPSDRGELGRTCRCGHGRVAHQHYRGGSDCSLCGCEHFRRPRRLRLGLGRRRR